MGSLKGERGENVRVFFPHALCYTCLSSNSYISSLAPATTGQAHWDSRVYHVTLGPMLHQPAFLFSLQPTGGSSFLGKLLSLFHQKIS